MRNEKRKLWQLIIGLLSLGGVIYVGYNYPPSLDLPTLGFFALLSISLWLITKYLLKSSIHATLISVSTVSYLIVRTFGLKQPLFLLLFIILFITLYLFFKRN